VVRERDENWQVGGGSPIECGADEFEQTWRLGLNMHPKWLGDGTAADFLLPLRRLGLRVLEFTLNLSSPDWPETQCLIVECRKLGFQLSFHAPFKGPYNLAGFSRDERSKLERLFRPAIDFAAQIAEEAGPTTIVIHGAKGKGPRADLRRDTEAFLDWILEEGPGLRPAIELLIRDESTSKIGDNKAEIVEIVSALDSPKVGICWDLGHDTQNGSLPIPPGFLPLVHHVHVYDIAPDGRDHCPILFGTVPYEKYLHQLAGAGYCKSVILEVNGYHVSRIADAEGRDSYQILQSCFRTLNQRAAGH
jgi:sugar phosphate isomerase/epimerase